MPSYLIFESTQPIEQSPVYTGDVLVTGPGGRVLQRNDGQYLTPPPRSLYGYECIGAVKAADETAAARAVVGATRRLTKLAVVEAVFIDFTATDEDNEPDAQRPMLNP